MSLTALKKSIKVGDTAVITNHLHPHLSRTTTVTRVQTNAIATALPPGESNHTESWCYWPKASECKVDGRRYQKLMGDGTDTVAYEIEFKESA